MLRNSRASERVSVGMASSMMESNSFSEMEQTFLLTQGSSLKSSLETKLIVPQVSPYSDKPFYWVFLSRLSNRWLSFFRCSTSK